MANNLWMQSSEVWPLRSELLTTFLVATFILAVLYLLLKPASSLSFKVPVLDTLATNDDSKGPSNPRTAQKPSDHGSQVLDQPKVPVTAALSPSIPPEHPKKTLQKDEYTVGIITVLDFELAAAKAILDEEHEYPDDFEEVPGDDNIYTWGRIGKHNVVIAAFEAGSYGIAPAATVARSMAMSISSLRVGLLVGIGEGFPTLRTAEISAWETLQSAIPREKAAGLFSMIMGGNISALSSMLAPWRSRRRYC